ncbi:MULTISPECIES: response regulator [Trichocoleus]|uniref:Response regulator n=1 Tax=Trichocoleus desertorum GB2-A4 TaxID=2933944 RepID=A0ABV0J6N3_9CYAN|nr:response regulator [Trichocoleus sp. FACHB-46]MBD1863558.1 response regulator [Trichocoleus sp. FACHB-46]
MSQDADELGQGSARILLIEDNDSNRQLLSDYLNYCGYTVLTLAAGAEFFTAIAQFQPHIVLLDLKLPDIDGYTLLEQLQQRGEEFQVPVIVVSAFAFQSDQRRALSLGARRYLVKPVNLNLLKQAIREELPYSVL